MITNNFKKIMANFPVQDGQPNINNLVNTFNSTENLQPQWWYWNVQTNGYQYGINSSNVGNTGYTYRIFTGTGTTTPTASDYTLETPVVLSCSSTSMTSGGTSRVISHTLTNNTGSDVTVNEVALTFIVEGGSVFILDRTVLTTPVTLADGASYSFTYNLDFNNVTLQ